MSRPRSEVERKRFHSISERSSSCRTHSGRTIGPGRLVFDSATPPRPLDICGFALIVSRETSRSARNSPAVYTLTATIRGALRECELALAQASDFPEAVRTRAFVRKKLGQSAAFVEDLRRYEELTKRDGLTKSWRLRVDSNELALERSPERQIEYLSRILLVEPDSLMARANLASALLRSGKAEEALVEIDVVRKADPELLYASFGKAMILLKLGREEDAVAEMAALVENPRFDEEIELDYQMVMVYPHLIDQYLRRGKNRRCDRGGREGRTTVRPASFLHGEESLRLGPRLHIGNDVAAGTLESGGPRVESRR